MSESRSEHRNPLPELADGWEGPAPGSRQTARRMGDKEGIHYKGLISHWALGICSPPQSTCTKSLLWFPHP